MPTHVSKHMSTHVSKHMFTHVSKHMSTHVSKHMSTHVSKHRYDVETNYDFIKVYGGLTPTTSPLLQQLTGAATQPLSVTSQIGEMLVVFTSDTSVVRAGFEASYTSETAPTTPPAPTASPVFVTATPLTVTPPGTSTGIAVLTMSGSVSDYPSTVISAIQADIANTLGMVMAYIVMAYLVMAINLWPI